VPWLKTEDSASLHPLQNQLKSLKPPLASYCDNPRSYHNFTLRSPTRPNLHLIICILCVFATAHF